MRAPIFGSSEHGSFVYRSTTPGFCGGHPGLGAPSSATATTAVHVQNRPTIRIKTLNARFMGSFSLFGSPGSGNPLVVGIIRGLSRALTSRASCRSSRRDARSRNHFSLVDIVSYFSMAYRLGLPGSGFRCPAGRRDTDCLRMRQR